MATIPTPTVVTPSGVVVTTPATAAAASQTFLNDGKTLLLVKNGGGSGITATFTAQATVPDGGAAPLAVANRTVAIAAGAYALIGPFPVNIFNVTDGSNLLTVGFDVTTSVLIQALRIPV